MIRAPYNKAKHLCRLTKKIVNAYTNSQYLRLSYKQNPIICVRVILGNAKRYPNKIDRVKKYLKTCF